MIHTHLSHACRLRVLGFTVATAISSLAIQAQVGDPATLIKEKLVSEIKLTKASAAHDDVVTAGDVVVLHKDGLIMCSSASAYAQLNVYNNGVLTPNIKNRAKNAGASILKGHLPFGGGGSVADAANNACSQRKFVSGEKFWVTDIALQKDGILVSAISDPYNNVRYYGEISFPFPKGSVPPQDDFVKTVHEVITVQPSDDKGGTDSTAAAGPAAAPAAAAPAPAAAPAAAMPAIAPPPPPADAPPPTIAIGETVDQVVAGFGQPTLIKKPSATKQIYVYKDMKVTFTNGKVSNIE
jgi:hypothetical protein